MRRYQLRTDPRGFPGILEDVVDAVTRADPAVSRLAAADALRVLVAGRGYQTERCGAHAGCEIIGAPVFGGTPRAGLEAHCGLYDPDASDLPRIFAAMVTDEGPAREQVIAAAFERAIAPYLYACDACGASPWCRGVPSHPTRG